MRTGMPYPKSIREAPFLLTGLDFFYRAYQTLSTERGSSGYIPWSAIQAYCHYHEIGVQQTEDMHYILMQLDTVRNEWVEKKGKDK